MEKIQYITSYLTFYLKGSVEFTNDNIVVQTPNTILGLIPLGHTKRTLDVNHIASTASEFRLDFKNLIIGVILIFIGLCYLANPDIWFLMLLLTVFGINMVLNAFITYVAVNTDSGEAMLIPLIIFERKKADQIVENINKILNARKYDTNVRIHSENAADRIVASQDQIVRAINELK